MRMWQGKSDVQTVRKFVRALNAREFSAVEAILADDFCMVDNADQVLVGAGPCMDLFRRVAEIAPDYFMDIHTIARRGDNLLISGKSESSHQFFASATQWRAKATDTHLLEWQSYSHKLLPSLLAMLRESGQDPNSTPVMSAPRAAT